MSNMNNCNASKYNASTYNGKLVDRQETVYRCKWATEVGEWDVVIHSDLDKGTIDNILKCVNLVGL